MFCNQLQAKPIGFLYASFRFRTDTQSKAAASLPHTALRKTACELKSRVQPVAAMAHAGGHSLAGALLPAATPSPPAAKPTRGGGQVPKTKTTPLSHAFQS